MAVLAGATLVTLMEEDYTPDIGDLAALALISCAAQNLRAAPCVPDIPERAVKYLSRRCMNRSALETDEDESEVDEDRTEIMQLRRDVDLVGEESNVLWWVFGERSRDTDERWSGCTVSKCALMAGKELSDLTRIVPGPAAAAALLDRVLKFAKAKPPASIALKDAISKVAPSWRQSFVKERCPSSLANLRPLSQGIKLSVELAEGDAWVAALASSTKDPASRENPASPRGLSDVH